MSQERKHPKSQLFTLRLWPEEQGANQSEWRGQVRHVISGETRYFPDWAALLSFLQSSLPELDDGNTPGE